MGFMLSTVKLSPSSVANSASRPPGVVQSEAHLLSATTQARLAREASRGSVRAPIAEKPGARIVATMAAPQGSTEKTPLISRKTGLPVYEPQSVMSSAHVFREYKQKGLPMPETKPVQAAGERSFFLPIVLALGVGAVAASTLFESGSMVLPPVATAALMQERDAVLTMTTTAALADAEVEAEKRLMEQQPLWLQRSRA